MYPWRRDVLATNISVIVTNKVSVSVKKRYPSYKYKCYKLQIKSVYPWRRDVLYTNISVIVTNKVSVSVKKRYPSYKYKCYSHK